MTKSGLPVWQWQAERNNSSEMSRPGEEAEASEEQEAKNKKPDDSKINYNDFL